MENSGAGEIAVNQSDYNIENIKSFLDNNDIAGAKNFLAKFLEGETPNQHACFVMAQILEGEGNFEKAAEFYEKVFTEGIPVEFYDRVLHVYEMADKYDNLYNIYKARYQQEPENFDVIERLANTCSILHKNEEAAELYNKILTLEPENPVALRQLLDIYENTNPMMFRLISARMAEIDGNAEKAEKEYKKAFTLAEKEEDILQIRYKMAKLYRAFGKNEQALDEYIYIVSSTEDNFSVFLELADIYLDLSNPSSAITVLKRALHIYPDNKEAMQRLADIYLENEEYEKAENYFERLLEAEPNNIENKVNLAKVYLNLNKLDKTSEILLKAEELDPNNTEVLTAMAGFNTYIEHYEKAKSYCSRIIQKLPNSPLGYRKLAQLYSAMGEEHLSHFNFGLYHELKNEKEEAIEEFMAAVSINKEDYESTKKLAELHEDLKEHDAALDYYHTLFAANVDIVETTKKIASIYMETSEFELAQRYLAETLKENKNAELIYLNAKCSIGLKDYDSALEDLEYYKENTKSLENLEEVEKLIEKIQDRKEISINPLVKLLRFFD